MLQTWKSLKISSFPLLPNPSHRHVDTPRKLLMSPQPFLFVNSRLSKWTPPADSSVALTLSSLLFVAGFLFHRIKTQWDYVTALHKALQHPPHALQISPALYQGFLIRPLPTSPALLCALRPSPCHVVPLLRTCCEAPAGKYLSDGCIAWG